MQFLLYISPLVAAVIGWLLTAILIRRLFRPYFPQKIAGRIIQGIIPKQQAIIAQSIGKAAVEFMPMKELEATITDPASIQGLMPQAEAHIDHFLRVKLVKSMPVVGMFIGEKTIGNFKSLFLNELEELFPEIMQQYIGGLEKKLDLEHLVAQKISSIPPKDLEKAFYQLFGKEMLKLRLLGALAGLLIGLLQLAILLAIRA